MVLRSVKKDFASNTSYYQSDCFQCRPFCPPKVGINALDNPGFELSPQFLSPWAPTDVPPTHTNPCRIIHGGAYGNSSRSYQSNSNGAIGCSLTQSIRACQDVIYEIGFDYRVSPKAVDSIYQFEIVGPGLDLSMGLNDSDNPKVWHTYSGLLDSPTEGSAYVAYAAELSDRKGESIELDNFRLIPTAYSFDTKPGANNVFVNGGFESGSLSPWTLIPIVGSTLTGAVVSPGINSKYAFQWNFTGNDDNGNFGEIGLTQNLTETGAKILSGTTYLISFDMVSSVANVSFRTVCTLSPYSSNQPQNAPPQNASYVITTPSSKSVETVANQTSTVQLVFTGEKNVSYIFCEFLTTGQTPTNGALLTVDNFSMLELALTTKT